MASASNREGNRIWHENGPRIRPPCMAALAGLLILFCGNPTGNAQLRPSEAPQPAGSFSRTALHGAPDWNGQQVFVGEIVRAALQPSRTSASGHGNSQPGLSGPGQGSRGPLPGPAMAGAEVAAEVRVVRPLNGGLQPGQHRLLRWPFPRPAAANAQQAQPVPMSQYGVFFLDAQGDPLPVRLPGAPAFLGGYLLPLPAETASAPKQPSSGRNPVEAALVAELLAAIEFWATAHGPQLDEAAMKTQPGGWYPSVEAGHFQQAISMMAELDPRPLREEFAALMKSPSAHVRLVGIHGLLQLQDFPALVELERDYAAYYRAMRPVKFQQALRAWALSASPRAIDVAGRLAIHQDMEPFLESSFAQGLAQVRVPDTLPYLITLLGSPHASTRVAALRGVCALTSGKGIHSSGEFRAARRPALLASHVPPTVDSFCPQEVPVRDVQQEQEIARFWRNWWQSNQATIASDFRRNERGEILPFPAAPAPIRWLDQTKPVVALMPGGPRVALHQLLYPFRPNSLGEGDPVPLLKRLLARGAEASDADWRNCAEVLRDHAILVQRIDAEHAQLARQVMMAEARSPQASTAASGFPTEAASSAAGTVLTRESVEASKARATEALLDQCLREMEQKLSAKGWHDFQEMLKQRAAGQQQFRTTSPNRPR